MNALTSYIGKEKAAVYTKHNADVARVKSIYIPRIKAFDKPLKDTPKGEAFNDLLKERDAVTQEYYQALRDLDTICTNKIAEIDRAKRVD